MWKKVETHQHPPFRCEGFDRQRKGDGQILPYRWSVSRFFHKTSSRKEVSFFFRDIMLGIRPLSDLRPSSYLVPEERVVCHFRPESTTHGHRAHVDSYGVCSGTNAHALGLERPWSRPLGSHVFLTEVCWRMTLDTFCVLTNVGMQHLNDVRCQKREK